MRLAGVPSIVQPIVQGRAYGNTAGHSLLPTPLYMGQQTTPRCMSVLACFLYNNCKHIKANFWFNP